MKNILFRSLGLAIVLVMFFNIFGVYAEDNTESTFCYQVPDTLRSLSLVANGYYTAAAQVGEDPEIFICDKDGIKWACKKRALAILLAPDGKYTIVGMNDGVEFYDNSRAVDITKSSSKELVGGHWEPYLPGDPDTRYRWVEDYHSTESTSYTCNPLWKYITKMETRILAINETASYIPVGAEDRVFVLDKLGKLVWDYQTDSAVSFINIVENYIAVGSQRTVYLFKTNGDLIWTYSVSGVPGTIDISRTGPYVSVGTSTGNLYLFDGQGNVKWSYKHKSAVNSISMTRLGTYIVAGSTDGSILYFNREGTKLWSYKAGGAVNQIDISPQGQYVAAGADKDGYYLFDWNGKKLWNRTNREIYFWAIHVADDGKWLLGGSGKFMGASTEMRMSNNVCFFNTVNFAKAGEQPDKNTEVTTTPTETTTTQVTNKLPLANAGTDFETKIGNAVRFDGTKSSDEDGNIVAYKWDFGDGITSIDAEPLHQYTTAGIYKVTLTVTDDKGGTGQDILHVTVKESQPDSPIKGVPGFELPALLGGSAVAYYIISRRKRK